MSKFNFFKKAKIGFIGAGNMGQAILNGLIDGGADPKNIYVTTKTEQKLKYIADKFGVNTLKNNEEVVDLCGVIVLGVKPQDLYDVVEPIAKSFSDEKIVISMAAGISIDTLKKWLVDVEKIIRIMPNTPVNTGTGVMGYCTSEEADHLTEDVEDFFAPLGMVVEAEEGEAFEALTVASGSGVGFVFELMIYWREWLQERGYDQETARQMVVQTFLGASQLADLQEQLSLDELQKKVVSKKGVTHAGLMSMRELEMERILRISFEKAAMRDRELGES